MNEYNWIVDNYGIRHILNKKAHGINTEILKKIYSVINTPNKLTKSKLKNKNIYSIKLEKNFTDYKITCIVEIRTKRKEIAIVTIYKNWLK